MVCSMAALWENKWVGLLGMTMEPGRAAWMADQMVSFSVGKLENLRAVLKDSTSVVDSVARVENLAGVSAEEMALKSVIYVAVRRAG